MCNETDLNKVEPSKTHFKLKNALIVLLGSKSYKEISVRELSHCAGIGFKTFYRNYSTLDEFAAQCIIDELKRSNDHLIEGTDKDILVKNGVFLFSIVDRNSELFSLLKFGDIVDYITPLLMTWTLSGAKDVIESYTRDKNIHSLIANHIVNSVISLIKWRLENPKAFSLQKMALIYFDLVLKSSKHFLENISI